MEEEISKSVQGAGAEKKRDGFKENPSQSKALDKGDGWTQMLFAASVADRTAVITNLIYFIQ